MKDILEALNDNSFIKEDSQGGEEFLRQLKGEYMSEQKKGIGGKILKICLEEAKGLGLEKVFVLTYFPDYFRRFGFKDISKDQLPHKVWRDCMKCVYFPDCEEDALLKTL